MDYIQVCKILSKVCIIYIIFYARNKEGETLKVKSKRMRDTLVVSIGGELDHHTSEIIRSEMDELLEDPTVKNMIIDAKNLSFMDSSGVGVFIGRYKKLSSRGGSIAITNINSHIDKIFEVSGLYKIIKSYPSVQAALDDIKGD